MEKFIIAPGIYVVPNLGRIDCTNKVEQATQVKLYLNPHFSHFITATKEGVALLKKEKLTEKDVALLLQRAKTPDEVDWLLKVLSSPPLEKIGDITKKRLLAS